jgi:hypothetical protein
VDRDVGSAGDDVVVNGANPDAEEGRGRGMSETLVKALRAVEAHHAGMCNAAGRPQVNSMTLRIVRSALAGCDHLAGDVCRLCYPHVPSCSNHPDAAVRRFGPLWRCGECGDVAEVKP